MTALLRALVLGYAAANRLRTGVTILAVALGVAIALAVSLANATAVASFASSVNVISNHVNLQVLGTGVGFDERTLLRVRTIPGVREASPAIEDSLTIGARAGDVFSGETLRVLGVDMLQPLPVAGTPTSAPDPWLLVNGHGALVSARVAAEHHWRTGSRIAAVAGDRRVTLVVAGVLPPDIPGIDSSVVFVDIATAQEVFGKLGRLDRIDCIVDPQRLAAIRTAVQHALPPGARAIEPRVRTGEIQRMLQSFELNLAALSYIALLVGMYLIYNTVAISVVQRRAEIGTLRAIGARRGQIFGTFLLEGALFGAAGSLLGVGMGCLLAHFSVSAVSRTVDTLYVASHADGVVYDPLLLLEAFAIGVAAAMLAAIVPAIDAARTQPAITMRAQGFERPVRRLGACSMLAAALFFAAGYVCTLAPAVNGVPLFGYAAGLCFIFGGSLAAPAAIGGLARLGRQLFGSRSPIGALASVNLGASPIRNSVAVASLMIAIAMTVAVAILIGSFRTTVVAWAADTLKADLFIRPLGLGDASTDATFSPGVAQRIAQVPGVARLDVLRTLTFTYEGRITNLGATDLRAFATRGNVRWVGPHGALDNVGSGTAYVSEPFASKFGARTGDRVTLDTPSGKATFSVAGVYNDYSSDAGMMLVDLTDYRRLYRDPSINSIAVYAASGTDPATLRNAILHAVRPLQIDVQTTSELRRLVVAVFDRTFSITYALYVISITIAMLGVVSTLFALVLERRREIGLLRYLGMRTRDVRGMVLVEAGYIGLLGGGLGILIGVVLSLLLIFVINRQAFGWLIELHMPWDFLAEALVVVVIAAIAAGLYPAAVAARMPATQGLRTE